MQNFTYRSAEERRNIEEILRQRRKKFNMQQVVSAVIFCLIVGSLILYFAFHIYYTEYDGYVHVDANKVRTPYDIYLDSVYVNVGDIVAPGDTLYSYYIIDQLLEHANPYSEPAILSRNRDFSLQYQSVANEVAVMRVKIEELKKQIEIEDHNISFGLSNNSHKLDLQRQLSESNAQLRALLNQLWLLSNMKAQTTPGFSITKLWGSGSRHGQQIFDDSKSQYLPMDLSYHLASDSSIVTDLMAPDRMVFFKQEEIMTTQHLDLEGNNLSIVAYIPVDQMDRITLRSKAEVVVNGDFAFEAHVDVLGMRTEMIPENLRSYFAKKNTAIIAILKIDEGQTVPLWTMAAGLPVSVRVRNTDTWGEEPTAANYLWYTTGQGVKIDLPDDWNYNNHINKLQAQRARDKALKDSLIHDSLRRHQLNDSIALIKTGDENIIKDNSPEQNAKDNTKKNQPTPTPTAKPAVTEKPAVAKPTATEKPAATKPATTEKPATAKPAATEKPAAAVEQVANDRPDPKMHYVIGASFQTEGGAKKQLKLMGAKAANCKIYKLGPRWAITLGAYPSVAEANKDLPRLREEYSMPNIWVWSPKRK